MMAVRVIMEDVKAAAICTNAQKNILAVSTPDEGRATLYFKVKYLTSEAAFTKTRLPHGTAR